VEGGDMGGEGKDMDGEGEDMGGEGEDMGGVGGDVSRRYSRWAEGVIWVKGEYGGGGGV